MTAKRILIIITAILILAASRPAVAHFEGYTDIRSDDWFYNTVSVLSENKIINGYPDSTFQPNGKINVDAFIKMTVTAMGYTDIQNGQPYWASTFIDKAKTLGLIDEGQFTDYERPISRAEMSVMVVRAMNETYPDNLDDYTFYMRDYLSLDADLKEYILKAYCKGILTGYPDGTFGGEKSANRVEAATIIHRLIDPVVRKVPVNPEDNPDALYMYDSYTKKEMIVKTSYSKFINHIKNGMKIMEDTNHIFQYWSHANKIEMEMYTKDTDINLPVYQRVSVLDYHIYTENNRFDNPDYYIPFEISLYKIKDEVGLSILKKIVMDLFPDAYDIVMEELNNKLDDINYENKRFEIINGKYLAIPTFKGYHQVDIYIRPEMN